MPLIAVLGRVAVDEFPLTVEKHYRKLDAGHKIRRTVGFASSLRLPRVCYVQIWHAHFMNGVFHRTAIFNHLRLRAIFWLDFSASFSQIADPRSQQIVCRQGSALRKSKCVLDPSAVSVGEFL